MVKKINLQIQKAEQNSRRKYKKNNILGISCQIAEDQRQRVNLKVAKEKETVILLKVTILIFSEYTSQLK